MQIKLSEALGECLRRVKEGEPVEACLADYPRLRRQLVPLLHTALLIDNVPRISPSDEFRKKSRSRMMSWLRDKSTQAARLSQARSAANSLSYLLQTLGRAVSGPVKVAVPIALVLVIGVQGLLISGRLSSASSTGLTAQMTLSNLTGSVQLQSPGATAWEDAVNGMKLVAGSRVRTAPNAQALLTFFNGTTVKLEADTDLVVTKADGGSGDQPTNITLKQWLGKTWSRVTKLADSGSHFGIETPSGVALVRGTYFTVEVDEAGNMTEQTIEGLVSVNAQGQEVLVPPGQQTTVQSGLPPAKPSSISPVQQSPASNPPKVTSIPPAKAPPADTPKIQGNGQSPAGENPERWQLVSEWLSFSGDRWMYLVLLGVLVLAIGLIVITWRKQ